MKKQLAKRLLASVFVLIGVSIIAFLLVRLGGGDPASMMAGDTATPEEIEEYLSRIPDIQESVVLGRKNAQGEVVITALIYADPTRFEGKEKAEIFETIKTQITDLNKTLPAFKQIREIEIRDMEFEKTTSRKIKRFKVD